MFDERFAPEKKKSSETSDQEEKSYISFQSSYPSSSHSFELLMGYSIDAERETKSVGLVEVTI